MSSDSGGEAGEAVERTDLVRYFQDACRARRGGPARIGIEHELLPLDPHTGAARPYPGDRGIESVFRGLFARGFEDPLAAPEPTRAVRDDLAVNVEPGGQTEISGAPHERLDEVERELAGLWADLRDLAARAGFRYISHGLQPVSLAHEIGQVPKRRYAIMTAHFEAHGGPRFRDMMRRTGSVQASFDFDDEADAGRKLRLGLLAAPFLAAIFANSPISAGRPSGFASERAAIWLETDDARTGLVSEALEGEWSFERYVDYALRVPTILVRAPDGGVGPGGGRPFGDLLEHGIEGRRVTLADWEVHLSTIFTDARLKRIVEWRACDAPRPAEVMAVPALATGLLHDPGALEAATALVAPYLPRWREIKAAVARQALAAPIGGGRTVLDIARELVTIARGGLRARRLGEERYLEPLEEVLATGRPPAARALRAFERGGIAALIDDAQLPPG
jgi:glutamate--cysteine ligase